MMPIKITVVTVVYNAVDSLDRTMRSVLEQTYDNIEYIVIDGGSTDGTVDIIKKYSDRLAYWVSEPDKGIYDAMNKGIRKATGEWINFMNAGDHFCDSTVIARIATEMENTDVVYGDAYLHENGELRPVAAREVIADVRRFYPLPFYHQAVFVRIELARRYGFDTQYRIAADYDFFVKCVAAGAAFRHVRSFVCVYDGDGISSKQMLSTKRELLRISRLPRGEKMFRYLIVLIFRGRDVRRTLGLKK